MESSGLPTSIRQLTIGGAQAVIGATLLVVAVAAAFLLSPVGSAEANGLTFPVAVGGSGPYEYRVGVGPFSPLRKAIFVAVTLTVGGNPVVDANVTLSASVDGSLTEVGPLDAVNTPIHPWTYEVYFDLPDLAREKVFFNIEVDSRHGQAVIRTEMIVPEVDDSVLMTPERYPSNKTSDTGMAGPVYLGIALVAGFISFGLAAWGLIRYRRRRS